MIVEIEPDWEDLQLELDLLNRYAIAYRYPGNSATKADAKEAVTGCRLVRRVIRLAFNLPV